MRTRIPGFPSGLIAALFLIISWEPSFLHAAAPDAVSGFMTVTVKGHGGHATSAISFIGLGLTCPVVAQGTLETASDRLITDQEAAWQDDQFNDGNGAHYLEITSGVGAGVLSDILKTDAETKTLTLADDLSSMLSGGESYKIRKHWTLSSLFGPHNEAGLGGGNNVSADEILIYDPVVKAYSTYFYKTSGLGGTGWRSSASSSTDQANLKLDLTRGILIRRKQINNINFKVFGVLKTGDTQIPIYSGLNILGNTYLTGKLTLGNSHLYTGDSITGLAGGSNLTADRVLIYNGTTYDTYYYKTQGLGGTGWRSTSNPSVDVSNTVIPGGSSILIQRLGNRGPFYWIVEQPF